MMPVQILTQALTHNIQDPTIQAETNPVPQDLSFEFLRTLAGNIANCWQLHGVVSAVAGIVGWTKAIFGYHSFTGMAFCHAKEEDEEYFRLYMGILIAIAAITFPVAFYEQFRKARKFIHLYGKGTKSPPYAPSSHWLKIYNPIMSVTATAMTGWNIGTLFGREAPETTYGYTCLNEGWQMTWKTVLFGMLGASVSAFLAGFQVYSFLGKHKARLGDTLTAVMNSAQKLASTTYPMVQGMIKSDKPLSRNDIILKVLATLFYLVGSTTVYRRSNKITRLRVDTYNKYEAASLKKKIATFKKKMASLPNDKLAAARKKAIAVNLDEANKQLQALMSAIEFEVDEQALILIEPTFPGHVVWDKLWRFLLAGCSSVASAYLTFLSLRAIYEREGLNPDGQPAVMLEYFNIGISSVYCVRSLFRYMVPYCGIGSEPAAESDEEQPLLSKPNVVGMKETLEDTLKKIEKELLSAAKPKGPFV